MNPADCERPRESPESFQVDTEEIAAIERLRQAQAADLPSSRILAMRLRMLWDRIQAAPRLAGLVRMSAELRNPPARRSTILPRVLGGEEPGGPQRRTEPGGIDPT